MPKQKEKKKVSPEIISEEFEKFLKKKGYDLSVKAEVEEEPSRVPLHRKRIRKISEDLNSQEWGFEIFTDTTMMVPGLVVYVIEEVEPTDKKPYVTYKPAPRIITEIHDNGVNKGTMFLTYVHRVSTKPDFNKRRDEQVIADKELIYSPLTKPHAEYICKLLNLQSKQTYLQNVKKAMAMKEKTK